MRLNKQAGDFLVYFSGSMVLAMVAIIKLPLFTSYFSPAEFGIFSLVSITYTYLAIALYNWITSCLYRYYLEYRNRGEKPILFSNLVFLFILSSIVLFLISATWYCMASESALRILVLLAFGYLFTNQVFSLFLVIYKIEGRAYHYNIFQAVQSVLSVGMIMLLIFSTSMRIEAIFAGQIVVCLILLVVIFFLNRDQIGTLRISMVSRRFAKKLLNYGFVGFLSSAGVLILISSDRYIIAMYAKMDMVGIYNQVYQVGQVSVYFLVTVFFNAITPGLNKLLTTFSPEGEVQLNRYIRSFLLIVMPVTFYLSVFSEQVAEFLLGEEFRKGYVMIPWIMVSSFLYGLTLFNETKLKFENRYTPLISGILLACIINVVLNLVLIPEFGYTIAATTTFVAYVFLFIYYYLSDTIRFFRKEELQIIGIAAIVFFIQFIADLFLRNILGLNLDKWYTLLEILIFFLIYIGIISLMKPNRDLFKILLPGIS